MKKKTLTMKAFEKQMDEVGVKMLEAATHVVIRGEDGDYGLAAVHTDGKLLVFDLGQKIED